MNKIITLQEFATPEEQTEINSLHLAFSQPNDQFYLVGGCVRDIVLGVKPKDFDFATNLLPETVIERLKTLQGVNILEVGKSFGVVVAVFQSTNNQYEIATFRAETYEVNNRNPEVKFCTIEEDVKRRDFTINGLFVNLSNMEVVDLVGGLEDLQNKVIRTIGKSEDRFNEDRLRVLRAVRFYARFEHATMEASLQTAIHNYTDLSYLSQERVREEFVKGVGTSFVVSKYLEALQMFGLTEQMFPYLNTMKQKFPVTNNRHTSLWLYWLLSENTPKNIEECLRKQKYSLEEIKETLFFVRLMQEETNFNAYKLKKQQLATHVSTELLTEWFEKFCSGHSLKKFIQYKLSVSATELMEQGFTGQALGRELELRENTQFAAL